ncbi:hypothetical protein D3C80_1637500 [compost metagenome]
MALEVKLFKKCNAKLAQISILKKLVNLVKFRSSVLKKKALIKQWLVLKVLPLYRKSVKFTRVPLKISSLSVHLLRFFLAKTDYYIFRKLTGNVLRQWTVC